MQYLLRVPQYGSHLKWISVFLEVWAGVLWIDTMSVCSACIKETLQLFAGGWYVSIRIRLLFKNHLYFFFQFRQVVYHYAPENIG